MKIKLKQSWYIFSIIIVSFLIAQSTTGLSQDGPILENVKPDEIARLKIQLSELYENHLPILPLKFVSLAEKYLDKSISSVEFQNLIAQTSDMHENMQVAVGIAQASANVEHWYKVYTFMENTKALIQAGKNYVELDELDSRVRSLRAKAEEAKKIIDQFTSITDAEEAQKLLIKLVNEIETTREQEYSEAIELVRKMFKGLEKELDSLKYQERLNSLGQFATLFTTVVAGLIGSNSLSKISSKSNTKLARMDKSNSGYSHDNVAVTAFGTAAASAFGGYLLIAQGEEIEKLRNIFKEQVEQLERVDKELRKMHKSITSDNNWIKNTAYLYYRNLIKEKAASLATLSGDQKEEL